jgi:hypothetical protein
MQEQQYAGPFGRRPTTTNSLPNDLKYIPTPPILKKREVGCFGNAFIISDGTETVKQKKNSSDMPGILN